MSTEDERRVRAHGGARWWYLLLALPFLGLLYPPLYATKDPELFGFPFFYWYQFLWVPIGVICVAIVYAKTKHITGPVDRDAKDGRR